MKANEFIKKYGIAEAKSLVNAQSWTMRQVALSTIVDTKELTKLVESHELVNDLYGVAHAKKYVASAYTAPEVVDRLNQAIADVESCQ